MAESLLTLALVMQNDEGWQELVEPTASPASVKNDEIDESVENDKIDENDELNEDDEIDRWLQDLRARHASPGDPAGNS